MKTETKSKIKLTVGVSFAISFLTPLSLTASTSAATCTTTNGITTCTTSANASVTVASACTFSGGNNTYSVSVPNGTTKNDIGTTTLKTVCNDAGGYAIYAVGKSGDEFGNNKLLANTAGSTNDINTATSGDSSFWAMKIGAVSGTYAPTIQNSFNDWHIVPNAFTKIASFNSQTDGGTIGSSITATYEVKISNTQPADTYTGKVHYALVHPASLTADNLPQPKTCANNKICYYANAYDVVGTMGQQTANPTPNATLLASNFSRTGYGFVGWSDKYDWELNANDANGNGTGSNEGYHIYGPQATITTPSSMTAGLSLYAVWAPNQGNLQSWTGCSSLNQGKVTALTDTRDGQVYAVAKLADGKCWMIENLRLEAANSSDSTKARGFGGVFTGLADAEAPWANNSTTANSLYSTDGSTANTISGSNQGYRFPRYNNYNHQATSANRPQNPTTNSATNSTTSAGMYSYGNYYTWSAAMANTENLTSYSASEAATTSLCPTGWRLPTGGDKTRIEADDGNEFWNLIVDELNGGTQPANYSSSTTPYYTGSAEAGPVDKLVRSYPNNFLYSGYVYSRSVYDRGDRGFYWSTSANGASSAYRLYFFSTSFTPGTYNVSKYYGVTVRCTSI